MTGAAAAAIVHYHEISLKRGNRPLFLRQLHQNLLRAIGDLGPVELVQLPGRIMLDLSRHPAPRLLPERLARVAGVANFALAIRTGVSREALRAAVEQAIASRVFGSFRITARRAFKTFPMTSVELNRDLGAHVLALRPDVRVSLEHPELNVRVEVLPDEAFVYCDPQPGAGGLPVGTGGTVAALLSGGIDSPVAAWRLMRRGCRVVFVHFHSVPYLPDLSRGKARELVTRLTQWQYHSRLFIVPFGEIQREVVLSVPPPFRVVVYRRLMVRIAERAGPSRGRARARHRGEPGAGGLADAPQPRRASTRWPGCRSSGRSSAWTSSRSPGRPTRSGPTRSPSSRTPTAARSSRRAIPPRGWKRTRSRRWRRGSTSSAS